MSKLVEYINENLSFRDEYYRIFGKHLPLKKTYCCFHPNTDTPAAAMYDNKMYCFVCRRMYGVYDLLKKYDPARIDEIKSTILLPEVSTSTRKPQSTVVVDNTKSLNEILHSILD